MGLLGVALVAIAALEVKRRRESGYVHVSADTLKRLRELEGQ